MELSRKYVDFIVENLFEDKIKVTIKEPSNSNSAWQSNWNKGIDVRMLVEIEVLEKYTRSVLVKLKFDKYCVEKLVFLQIESAPYSIYGKFIKMVEKLVFETLVTDGREDEIKKMYEDKRTELSRKIKEAIENSKIIQNSSSSDRIVD